MTKLIVLLGFILSFLAGMLAFSRLAPTGEQAGSMPSTRPFDDEGGPTTRPGPPMFRGGFLPRELNLSDDQQKKIRQIWSGVAVQGPREMDEKRRAMAEARDAKVSALIPADKKAEYQKLQTDFTTQMQAMDAGFRKQFDDAVQQTEALLTPEQRAKYDEIRNHMRPFDDHGPGGHHHGPGDRGWDEHGRDDHGPPPGEPGGFDGGPGGPPPAPRDSGGF